MFDESATRAVNARMEQLLRQVNPAALIDAHEYCPHHPQAPLAKYRVDCDCRKPRPGMILKASRDLDLDLAGSWLVGDAPRDIEAGRAAGCRTILFVDASLPASPAAAEKSTATPDYRAGSLEEVAGIIERAFSAARRG
jgi:histidinol-phosphate phosphatase family protein